MNVPVEAYVFVSALLFCIGMIGVMVRRNALVVLLSVEIMLNAANLALVAFSRAHPESPTSDGQIFAVVSMAIAAAEVVVGLGIVVALSHLRRELDTDELSELHG